jgi:hypothetical protein
MNAPRLPSLSPRRPAGLLFAIALGVAVGAAKAQPTTSAGTSPAESPAAEKPAKPPKLPKEERRLLAVRQAMGVANEEEWRALQPYVSRVQTLTKLAKDLSEPGKALEPVKAPKAKDGVVVSAPPAYLVALQQHATDLRRAYEDPATGAEDIQKRIARYRASRDEALRQTGIELAAARAEFRELLTARQELAALVAGLLD